MDTRACIAGYLLLLAGAAWSQAVPAPAEGAGAEGGIGPERIELLRMWRMVEALDIGEEQATRLFPLWSQHNREKRELSERRRRLLDELSGLLEKGGADDAALRGQIDKLRSLEAEREDANERFTQSQAQLLTVRQQAQLLLFNERFRGELRAMLKDFRGAGAAGAQTPSVQAPSWWDRLEKGQPK